MDNLQKLMDVINKVRGKYQELTGQDFEDEKSYGWTVDYPNIELSLEWGWEEDEKTSLARYPIAFNFEFNPLIGITYKADVLGFLIEKWAGVGTIINYIRKKSERAVSLKIDFEFNGKISKKAKGNVILGQGDSSKSVNLEGSGTPLAVSIGASLTGSADLDIFIVRCGAEIKGACSVSLEFCQIGFDEDGAWTRSPVTFSGLVVTGMIYKASTAEIKNGEPGRSKKRIKDDPKSKKEKELLKVGAATWFEEKHYINKKSK
ncbi:MAG: hypothetical protein IPP51_15150 [Bacteroidetes bacterium]|nr:hypothetical protein [Bacteroidota bacterium]